jgi:hypothetical protein
MVELRGGIEALRGNWRLELVTFLCVQKLSPTLLPPLVPLNATADVKAFSPAFY